MSIDVLMKKMQLVGKKTKSSNKKQHHTYKKLFPIQIYEILNETMKREYMEIESSCTKTKRLIENSTVEIPTVVLRWTNFDYHDKSDQKSVFGFFGLSGS